LIKRAIFLEIFAYLGQFEPALPKASPYQPKAFKLDLQVLP